MHMGNRPMKIVYALESTGLYGGTKVILRQAEALTHRGHEVTVVSPGEYGRIVEGFALHLTN